MKNAFFTCVIIALSLSNANGEEWTNTKGQTITAGVVGVTIDGRVEFRMNGKSFFYQISDITGEGRKRLDAMLARKIEDKAAFDAKKAARDAEKAAQEAEAAKFAHEADEPLPEIVKAIADAGVARSISLKDIKNSWRSPVLVANPRSNSSLVLNKGDVGAINFELIVEAIFSDSEVLLGTPRSEQIVIPTPNSRKISRENVPLRQRFIRIKGISTKNMQVNQTLSPDYIKDRPLKGIFVVRDREYNDGQEIEILELVPTETIAAVFRHQVRQKIMLEPRDDYSRELARDY